MLLIRFRSKLLKLIKKEKELLAQGKVHGRYLTDGSHVIKKEDVDNDGRSAIGILR